MPCDCSRSALICLVDYVATDTNGLTSTSTRTVIIEPTPQSLPITNSPPLLPTDSAPSTVWRRAISYLRDRNAFFVTVQRFNGPLSVCVL